MKTKGAMHHALDANKHPRGLDRLTQERSLLSVDSIGDQVGSEANGSVELKEAYAPELRQQLVELTCVRLEVTLTKETAQTDLRSTSSTQRAVRLLEGTLADSRATANDAAQTEQRCAIPTIPW